MKLLPIFFRRIEKQTENLFFISTLEKIRSARHISRLKAGGAAVLFFWLKNWSFPNLEYIQFIVTSICQYFSCITRVFWRVIYSHEIWTKRFKICPNYSEISSLKHSFLKFDPSSYDFSFSQLTFYETNWRKSPMQAVPW